ncbi:RelA/SpoT domain-containing protein [Paracoccus yeei]|nr:RelA/SpoT domain-containing protein [Paracoccus yeei]
MADYPVAEYSKREIKDAGAALRERMPYTEEAVRTFRVAHNWRMAHALPMIREKTQLTRLVGDNGDTAGRIKRMDSIRKKLRRSPITLDRMQDLAGIRAIVGSVDEVRRAEAWYLARADQVARHDDYIASPKAGGYRSVHLIRRYAGSSEAHQGQKVEIQIRTRLQHVWATAGEAIGALRGEDLKAGEGHAGWLRLLAIMSGHFAAMEGCPMPPGVSSNPDDRRDELRALDADLSAAEVLSKMGAHERGSSANEIAYLVRLDAGSNTVTIEPKPSYLEGGEGYFAQSDAGERVQSVLVSVNGLDALRRTYANYFLDVGPFLFQLRQAMGRPSHGDILRDYMRHRGKL